MSKYVKPMVSALVVVAYLMALLFVADPLKPYFILGPAIAGLVAWLSGRVAGLMVAMLLIPATKFVYDQFDISTGFSIYVFAPSYIVLMAISAIGVGSARNYCRALKRHIDDLQTTNDNLQKKLFEVQELGGIHNICSKCKSIKTASGRWQSANTFLKENTKMEFTHCICPDCAEGYQDQEIEFNPERF